jgi:hypothetical protein
VGAGRGAARAPRAAACRRPSATSSGPRATI